MNPWAYSTGDIQRFDIVAFEMPDSEKQRVHATGSVRQIKRIVGLPNEKLEIRNDRLLINDAIVTEPFEMIVGEKDRKRNYGPIVVPDGEYFLLGDNRPESLDSRYFDHPTIKKADIYSRVADIKKGYYASK